MSCNTGLLSRIRLPGVQLIAVLSYAIYLTHSLALSLDGRLLPRIGLSLQSTLGVTLVCATILVFSALLHYGVERPVMAWRDRVLKESKYPRLAAPAQASEPAV
jgi:peptidoglycan/LPS O-acetylase OafA/YrhL